MSAASLKTSLLGPLQHGFCQSHRRDGGKAGTTLPTGPQALVHTGPQCSESSSSEIMGEVSVHLGIRQDQGITVNFVVCGTGIRESLFF